jgi:hypothetical protein
VKQTLLQPEVKAVLAGKRLLNATTTNFQEIEEIEQITKS